MATRGHLRLVEPVAPGGPERPLDVSAVRSASAARRAEGAKAALGTVLAGVGGFLCASERPKSQAAGVAASCVAGASLVSGDAPLPWWICAVQAWAMGHTYGGHHRDQVSALREQNEILKRQKRGERGEPGARGERGERGVPGMVGAPGLPGQRGMSGADGRNGRDGSDGRNGRDGSDGRNGRDGIDAGPEGWGGLVAAARDAGASAAVGELRANRDAYRGERGEPGVSPKAPNPVTLTLRRNNDDAARIAREYMAADEARRKAADALTGGGRRA